VRCFRETLPVLIEAAWKGRKIPILNERPAEPVYSRVRR
jgi:hypothetical protein